MSPIRTILAAPFVVLVYIAVASMLVFGWLAILVEGKK